MFYIDEACQHFYNLLIRCIPRWETGGKLPFVGVHVAVFLPRSFESKHLLVSIPGGTLTGS